MNVWTQSNSCWDVSVWTKVVERRHRPLVLIKGFHIYWLQCGHGRTRDRSHGCWLMVWFSPQDDWSWRPERPRDEAVGRPGLTAECQPTPWGFSSRDTSSTLSLLDLLQVLGWWKERDEGTKTDGNFTGQNHLKNPDSCLCCLPADKIAKCFSVRVLLKWLLEAERTIRRNHWNSSRLDWTKILTNFFSYHYTLSNHSISLMVL